MAGPDFNVNDAMKMLDAQSPKGIDEKELDKWLSKVEQVSNTVKGLREGTVEVEEADKVYDKLTKKERKKQQEAAEKRRKKRLEVEKKEKMWENGRPGKGTAKDFDKFCESCLLEFKKEKVVCPQCGKDLIDREVREEALKGRVQVLVEEKNQRKFRRERYKMYKSTRADASKAATDYNTWDYWEPSSTEDSDVPTPDTPEFKAMEDDINKRNAIRAEKARKSKICKEQGNEAFAHKNYKNAIGFYGQAMEIRKDDKFLYTNRALCYLQLSKFNSAEKDLNTALDIWEFLESGKKKIRADEHRKFAMKAYMRRAAARRGLKKWDLAMEDVQSVLEIAPDNKEVLTLKLQVERDLEEAAKSKEIMEQAGKESAHATEDKESKEAKTVGAMDDESSQSASASGSSFDRIVRSLEDIRAYNGQLDKAKEKLDDYKACVLIGEEGVDQMEEPTLPGMPSAVTDALATLQELAGAGNATHQKHVVFIREKKGVITLVKLMKSCLRVKSSPTLVCVCRLLMDVCENQHSKEAFVRADGVKVLTLSLTDPEQALPKAACAALQVMSFITEHAAARADLHTDVKRIWKIIIEHGVEPSLPNAVASAKSNGVIVGEDGVASNVHALSLLCNCAYDQKFRTELRAAKWKTLSTLVPLLDSENLLVASRAWGSISNLLTDKHFRQQFAKDDEGLKIVGTAVSREVRWQRKNVGKDTGLLRVSLFKKMLALTLNCATEGDNITKVIFGEGSANSQQQLLEDLVFLVLSPKVVTRIRDRCAGLLGRAARIVPCRAVIITKGGVEALLSLLAIPVEGVTPQGAAKLEAYDDDDNLMCESGHEHAVRALALLTADSSKAIDKCVRFKSGSNTGVQLIMKCLEYKNAQIAGNAALIVSVCCKDEKNLAAFRDAVPLLISLMKIEEHASMAKNAAIACARLARNPENLARIRELKGLELMAYVGQR